MTSQTTQTSDQSTEVKEVLPICIPYYRANDGNINDMTSEFNITFIKDDSSTERLFEFAEMFSGKRINIAFPMGVSYAALEIARKANPEIYVRVDGDLLEHVDDLRDRGIKYYFEGLCTSWEMLEMLKDIGTSDIYPGGDLMHSLDKVKKYCDNNNMKVRTVLNRVSNSQGEKACVFLPGSIDRYRSYIDTFEFDIVNPTTGKYNLGALDVLVKAYFINKNWAGDMGELIQDLEYPLYPHFILDYIYDRRFTCGMTCLTTAGKCRKCEDVESIAQKFSEKKVMFKH